MNLDELYYEKVQPAFYKLIQSNVVIRILIMSLFCLFLPLATLAVYGLYWIAYNAQIIKKLYQDFKGVLEWIPEGFKTGKPR